MTNQDFATAFDFDQPVVQRASAAGGRRKWVGYRLKHLQIRNFGGFHYTTKTIAADCFGTVLMGSNGSGKSTGLDALRTLIRQYPSYNSATESQKGDRSLKSYYLGKMGDGRHGLRQAGVPEVFMALMAVFENGDGRFFTIGRMTYYPLSEEAKHHYFTAPRQLSLEHDFRQWEGKGDFERRLEKLGGKAFSTFDRYMGEIATNFGFEKAEECLEAFRLLEEAIGSKTVSNVTDFARKSMFPSSNFTTVIENTVGRASAKISQVERMDNLEIALAEMQAALENLEAKRSRLARARNISDLKAKLPQLLHEFSIHYFMGELAKTEKELGEAEADLRSAGREVEHHDQQLRMLMRTASAKGFDKISEIADKIAEVERELQGHDSLIAKLTSQFAELDYHLDTNSQSAWDKSFEAVRKPLEAIEKQIEDIRGEEAELKIAAKSARATALSEEEALAALLKNKNALDDRLIQARNRIAEALMVTPSDLPFFAQLVQIRPGEEAWEGVANRALYGTATKILVPAHLYGQAKRAMNASRAPGLIIKLESVSSQSSSRRPKAGSLADKLMVKDDYAYAAHVRHMLANAADLACLDHDDFAKSDLPSCTKEGSIQWRAGSAQKDDRSDIGNRRNWVLGWSMEKAIQARTENLNAARRAAQEAEDKVVQCSGGIRRLDLKRGQLSDLLSIQKNVSYDLVDTTELEEKLDALSAERERMSSRESKDLQSQIDEETARVEEARERQMEARSKVDNKKRVIEGLSNGISERQEALARGQERHGPITEEDQVHLCEAFAKCRKLKDVPDYEALLKEHAPRSEVALNDLNQGLESYLTDRVDEHNSQARKHFAMAQEAVQRVLSVTPKEQDSISATFEYDATSPCDAEEALQGRYDVIRRDDLVAAKPHLLEDYVSEIQMAFHVIRNRITTYGDHLSGRMSDINTTLKDCVFDPRTDSRFSLLLEPVRTKNINQFNESLRACLETGLNAEPEAIVDAAKEFISAFDPTSPNYRESFVKEVSDLKNWHSVKLEERRTLENGTVKTDVYETIGEKSGGEKERFANVLNAAGLHCAFGNHDPERRENGLHLIILDEAFSNMTSEAALAVNKIFSLLDLQFLTASPEAKIGNYLHHAGKIISVSSREGQVQLQELSIEKMIESIKNDEDTE